MPQASASGQEEGEGGLGDPRVHRRPDNAFSVSLPDGDRWSFPMQIE